MSSLTGQGGVTVPIGRAIAAVMRITILSCRLRSGRGTNQKIASRNDRLYRSHDDDAPRRGTDFVLWAAGAVRRIIDHIEVIV